jgi:hypothetical protein
MVDRFKVSYELVRGISRACRKCFWFLHLSVCQQLDPCVVLEQVGSFVLKLPFLKRSMRTA